MFWTVKFHHTYSSLAHLSMAARLLSHAAEWVAFTVLYMFDKSVSFANFEILSNIKEKEWNKPKKECTTLQPNHFWLLCLCWVTAYSVSSFKSRTPFTQTCSIFHLFWFWSHFSTIPAIELSRSPKMCLAHWNDLISMANCRLRAETMPFAPSWAPGVKMMFWSTERESCTSVLSV